MKQTLLFTFLLVIICCAFKKEGDKKCFVIRIWDEDFSLGNNVFYQIDDDSVVVKYQSIDEGMKNLMHQKLTETQCKMVWNWLSAHNIDSFSTAYTDRRTQDGDQKTVEFKVGSKSKIIHFSNFYLKDIADLFDIINKIVRKDLQIRYDHPSGNNSISPTASIKQTFTHRFGNDVPNINLPIQ